MKHSNKQPPNEAQSSVSAASLFFGMRFFVAGGNGEMTAAQKSAADVNGDDKVDAKDASSILAYYALVSTASGDIPSMKEFMTPKQT